MDRYKLPHSNCPIHGARPKRDSCKQCNAAYMRNYMRRRRLETPSDTIWERARARARKRGVRFTITKDAVRIPGTCPVLGIPIIYGGQRTPNSPSLDRVIPAKGYVPGNVRVISDRANRLKGDRDLAALRLRAKHGRVGLRRDYHHVAAYVDREQLLSKVRVKASTAGRVGAEWQTIARFLEAIFTRESQPLQDQESETGEDFCDDC